jgi:hypothetical protein
MILACYLGFDGVTEAPILLALLGPVDRVGLDPTQPAQTFLYLLLSGFPTRNTGHHLVVDGAHWKLPSWNWLCHCRPPSWIGRGKDL